MIFIIYLLFIVLLSLGSRISGNRVLPKHATYTILIYPAVSMMVSMLIKKKLSVSSADFIIMYGKQENQMTVELSIKLASLIIFISIPAAVCSFSKPGTFEIAVCCSLSVMGYFIPSLDLKQRAGELRESILRDFPVFCMDLAVLVRTGLGLEKAWGQALSEKSGSILYKEAKLVLVRTETGLSMEESMIIFARRLSIPEIYSFSTVINQALKSGVESTAETIREYAMQSWNSRFQRAREKGEKASVKMVFPLAMGLAGVILVLAYPAYAVMKGLI